MTRASHETRRPLLPRPTPRAVRPPARIGASPGALAAAVTLAGTLAGASAFAAEPSASAAASPVEEIYMLRSLRETRQPPTDFCAKVPAPTSEDEYAFYTTSLQGDTGRVVDAKAARVGRIHGCFGRTSDAAVFQFYGAFEVNGLTGVAEGDCRSGKPDFPEAGLKTFACFFALSGLPAPYVGGQLTTNSVNSKAITGEASDPSGYTQVSIATVRLWKARP